MLSMFRSWLEAEEKVWRLKFLPFMATGPSLISDTVYVHPKVSLQPQKAFLLSFVCFVLAYSWLAQGMIWGIGIEVRSATCRVNGLPL